MVSDGVHSFSDYVHLAQQHIEFESVCHIYDQISHVSQTGVLVSTNCVVTAAHGVVSLLKTRNQSLKTEDTFPVHQLILTFSTRFGNKRVRSKAVKVDWRYLTPSWGEEAKYDFAWIELDESITDIQPARLFEQQSISQDALLTVVTWSMADQRSRDH